MKENVFVYRINKENIITSVSDNWHSFAGDNAWTSEISPKNVVGHLIWDFIQGLESRHLYEELFKRVRSGKSAGPIPFRCDSPRERRFLELFLSPLTDGQIEITSIIIRREFRDKVRLLEREALRSRELIRICSMCKKIAIHQNTWVEIEEGVVQLRLFEVDEIPGLTHGMCPSCYEVAMANLEEIELPNK